MIISQTSFNQNHFSLRRATDTTHLAPSKLSENEGKNNAESIAAGTSYYKLARLQSANAAFNSVAENIRVADAAMKSIENQVNQMQHILETRIKNFPPFPPGSEERVKLLKSFNAFRKQIDKMTIPPRHDYASKIMADPSVNPKAGSWEIIIGENGHSKTIQSKEVHTGPTGLNIPKLPENASNDIVDQALSRIENAITILKRSRTALSQDVSEIAQLKIYSCQLDDISEPAAESKSIEIKSSLSNSSSSSLTVTPSRLTHLLNN